MIILLLSSALLIAPPLLMQNHEDYASLYRSETRSEDENVIAVAARFIRTLNELKFSDLEVTQISWIRQELINIKIALRIILEAYEEDEWKYGDKPEEARNLIKKISWYQERAEAKIENSGSEVKADVMKSLEGIDSRLKKLAGMRLKKSGLQEVMSVQFEILDEQELLEKVLAYMLRAEEWNYQEEWDRARTLNQKMGWMQELIEARLEELNDRSEIRSAA